MTGRTSVPLSTAGAAAAAAAAAIVGATTTLSPALAAALVGAVVIAAITAFFDVFGLAVTLTAALPWLIVTSNALPRLALTFAAGATALVVLAVAQPRSDASTASFLLRAGTFLFVGPMVLSLMRDGVANGYTLASKYAVFPLMVFAVTAATNHRDLLRLRNVAFWSSVAAIAVNLFLGLTGIVNFVYYGSGEILGLGSEHVLALLAGTVTAASLAGSLSLMMAPVVAVCGIATVATGVRSPLPGLAAAALVRMASAGVRLRMIALVAVGVAAIFVSGAAHVVVERFQQGKARGEYQSLATFGSGRGSIYAAALDGWKASPAPDWVIGTGFNSIQRFEIERLGQSFVGHSDIVNVLVQLGVIGLVGLVFIWWSFIQRATVRLPLLVLGSFALFNGILEYSGPVVIAALLTVGVVRAPVAKRADATAPAHSPARA